VGKYREKGRGCQYREIILMVKDLKKVEAREAPHIF
jgi:hypothetical protein